MEDGWRKEGVSSGSQLSLSDGEEWQYCYEFRPKPKERCTFVEKRWKDRYIARNGVRLQGKNAARDVEGGSEQMKMPGKCEGPLWLGNRFQPRTEKIGKALW